MRLLVRSTSPLRHLFTSIFGRMVPVLVAICMLIFGVILPKVAHSQVVNVLSQIATVGNKSTKGNKRFTPDSATTISGVLTQKTGNSPLLQAKLGFAWAHHSNNNLYYLIARGRYGERDDGDKSTDDRFSAQSFTHVRYRRSLLSWLGVESFIQHEYDQFRRLELRAVGGLGARVSGSLGEMVSLHFGTAYMFEREVYTDLAVVSSPTPTAVNNSRLSSYIQFALQLDKTLSLHNATFIQPRLDDFNDLRILTEAALVIKANAWLTVKISGRVAYDSAPPKEVQELDTSIETTLGLSL